MIGFEQFKQDKKLARSKTRMKIRRNVGAIALTVLAVMSCLVGSAAALENVDPIIGEFRKVIPSIEKREKSEGLLLEAPPSYINFLGTDGLELEISLPSFGPFDFTIMFWFRSVKSYKELSNDDSLKEGKKAYLFEIPNADTPADMEYGVACYMTNPGTGPILSCAGTDEEVFQIDLENLPDVQAWMHLTFSTNYRAVSKKSSEKSRSYVRIDTSNNSEMAEVERHTAIKIKKDSSRGSVFYGSSHKKEITERRGFPGHYRQFWISLGYLEPANIPQLMHQQKVLDYSTMGYYKFEQKVLYGRFADAFRNQTAIPIDQFPLFEAENIAAPFCNSIPQKFEQVPQFYKSAGNKFKGLQIPRFKYKGRDIGYTASFWLQNFGKHYYSKSPHQGRDSFHMIKLDECFALWYDSRTSFRVYVYAKNNYEEVYSSPIFLPLYEWVNIQIAFTQQDGIVVMTFNQNGDRQQLVQNKVYLAEQYPRGQLHLFQQFVGLPYQLHIWERFIQLPIDFNAKDLEEEKIVSFDFTKNYYSTIDGIQGFTGWTSLILKNGENIEAKEGEGFDFIYANVPSAVNFQKPSLIGQLQATETQWNDVTCPPPENSQMFLGFDLINGKVESTEERMKRAFFQTAILVDTTDRYTVEFWFKADPEVAKKLNETNFVNYEGQDEETGKSVTYLFNMKDQSDQQAMAIYVEDGMLKCAPYGYTKNRELVLNYAEFNPDTKIDVLNEKKWQHISCIYIKDKYVKGQYLAVDMKEDGVVENFERDILVPYTFARTFVNTGETNENEIKQRRWTVDLGNLEPKWFAGSYKDVRLWKSARTDAELYSKRFTQIEKDENLAGNLKFMDGNPYIFNSAGSNTGGIEFANIEPNMILSKSDKTNLICASDTYFDQNAQSCTRYPYTDSVSIIYMVTNNVQYGHNMILKSIVKSPMFLPGKYQPDTRFQWSMLDPTGTVADKSALAVQQKYFQQNQQTWYNFDPIFMGDFTNYKFQLKVNDEDSHNFFVTVQQDLVPRKCIQVIDSDSHAPINIKNKILKEDQTKETPLVFQFYVEYIDGCSDEQDNFLRDKVQITSQPPLPNGLDLTKYQSFDRDNKKFTITIPVDIQLQMLKNVPVDMIFYLFWNVDDNSGRESYMNILYTVTIASRIDVKFERMDYDGAEKNIIKEAPEQNVVDTSVGVNDLRISAENSKFAGSEFMNGLSFKWECAVGKFPILQGYCEQWNGSPVLQIPSSMVQNEWIDEDIVIKVIASSIETSEMDDPEKQAKEAIFRWVKSESADFDIIFPNKCTKAQGDDCPFKADDENNVNRLLTSVSQKIEVRPKGWNAIGGYKFDYQIVNLNLNETVTIEQPEQQVSSTIFDIEKDILIPSTQYTITVTVSNPDLKFIEPKTDTQTFFTGALPEIKTMSIQPILGIMFKDEFIITMADYPDAGLSYQLYGIVSLNVEDDELKLTTQKTALAASPDSYTTQLPELVQIKAVISDSFGEVVEITRDCTVSKAEDATWIAIAEAQKTSKLTEQKENLCEAEVKAKAFSTLEECLDDPISSLWQSFLSIGSQANAAAQSGKTSDEAEDAIAVNKLISENAFEDIRKIPRKWVKADSVKDYDTTVDFIILTISKISKFYEFMSIEIMQNLTETIEYILRIDDVIRLISKDESKRKDFTDAIGNLMDQISQQAYVKQEQSKYGVNEDIPVITWNRRMLEDISSPQQLRRQLQDQNSEETVDPKASTDEALEEEAATVGSADDEVVVDETDAVVNNVENDLFDLLQLMKKMIVIKNSYLDQICKTDELWQTSKITIKGDQIEFIVERHSVLNTDLKDVLHETKDQLIKITLPGKFLLERTKIEPAAEWLCFQTTFMSSNPIAGYSMDSQFYHKDQQFIQVGTLDNTGNRMIDQDGLLNQEVNPFQIEFIQELTKENQWFNGQTIIAHFDGNEEQLEGQYWSTRKVNADEIEDVGNKVIDDCISVYNMDVPQSIVSTCTNLHNFYYTVITDRSRTHIQPPVYQNKTHTVLYLILIIVFVIGAVFPIIMIYLDSRDYQMVEDNFYEVDDLMIAKLEYNRNYLCKQMIYYKEKEIAEYRKLKDQGFRSGSVAAFMTFHRTLHPYFSLFSNFDYQYKRLTRFSFVLGQTCMITLMLWICYSKLFHDWGITEGMGDHRQFYISLGLSIFTLPMPRRCCCFFKTQMYLLQVEEDKEFDEDDEEKQSMKQAQDTDADGAAEVNHDDDGGQKAPGKEDDGIRPVLFDKWLQLKCVSLLFIFIFWMVTLAVCYFLVDYSGSNDPAKGTGSLYTFVELTESEAEEFMTCWFLAIFVWGVIINEIRIVIISLMAPIRAQSLFERQMGIMARAEESDGKEAYKVDLKKFHTSWGTKASFATCCLIPPESVEIALDALFTIAIEKDKGRLFNDWHDEKETVYAFNVKKKDRKAMRKAVDEGPVPDQSSKGGDVSATNSSKNNTKRSNAPLIVVGGTPLDISKTEKPGKKKTKTKKGDKKKGTKSGKNKNKKKKKDDK